MWTKRMKMVLGLLAGTAAGVVVGQAAIALMPASIPAQDPVSTTVSSDRWFSVTTPENMTAQESTALLKALMNETPVPAGFSIVANQGQVDIKSTGLLTPTKWQAVATVVDDLGDIDEARLYVDGVLKRTATFENGQLENVGNQAIATMTLFLPQSGPYEVRVEWEADYLTVSRTIRF